VIHKSMSLKYLGDLGSEVAHVLEVIQLQRKRVPDLI